MKIQVEIGEDGSINLVTDKEMLGGIMGLLGKFGIVTDAEGKPLRHVRFV